METIFEDNFFQFCINTKIQKLYVCVWINWE